MGEQVMESTVSAERPGAGQAPHRPVHRRLGRRAGRVLLVAALVVLLIWGVMFLRVLVLLPHTAQQEASEGYELTAEEFAGLAAADAELLEAEFGPALSIERTVHCAVEPADSGWFTVDHHNRCTLREVELRAVPESVDDPGARASALLGEAEAWQGEAGYLIGGEESCAVAGQSRLPADGTVPGSAPNLSLAAVVVEEPGDLDSCLTDLGPSARALGSATAEVPGGSAAAGPDGTRLLALVREARISSSSLGCLPLPIFCEPAVSEPRLPDVPDR